MIPISDTAAGATFAVKIHPRAKRNAITGEMGGAFKLSLTAPPVEGRANEAVVEFLASVLRLPRSSISIASGQSRQNKVVRIAGITADALRQRLEPLL